MTVVFEAGNKIVLKPGFRAVAGSNFMARIGDCKLGCDNGRSEGSLNKDDYEMVIFDSRTSEYNENTQEFDIANDSREDEPENFSFVIYPSPASESVTVNYTLHVSAPISIGMYNIFGQMMKLILLQQTQDAGDYSVQTSVSNLESGTYFIKVSSANQAETKQVIINRQVQTL